MDQLTVVLAMRDTHAEKYRDRSGPVSIGTLPVWDELRDAIEQQGHRFLWLEEYQPAETSGPVAVLWDFGSFARLPRMFRRPEVVRVIAWSLESPLVAHRAYHRLDDIAREADVVVGFSGACDLISPARRDKFIPIRWPYHHHEVIDGPPFDERKLLVMVNSNKRANTWWDGVDPREPYASARRIAASLLASTYQLRGKWTVPDLYEERLRAIAELASHPRFDLYGTGWSDPVPGRGGELASVVLPWRGAPEDKLATMSRYRFSLIIENTSFPGYVTEKIFDAFAAGTVPVYLGAPDIEDLAPRAARVTVSQDADYREIIGELERVDATEWEHRRLVGRALLESRARKPLDSALVSKILRAISSETAASSPCPETL